MQVRVCFCECVCSVLQCVVHCPILIYILSIMINSIIREMFVLEYKVDNNTNEMY